MSRTIWVYENWSSTNPIILGRLYVDGDKRAEKFSFEYDDNLVFPPSNIGLKINLDDASYYLDNFPFYTKTSLGLSKYDLIIYEYK